MRVRQGEYEKAVFPMDPRVVREGTHKLCCDRKKEETVANLAMVTGEQYIYNLFLTQNERNKEL